MTDQQSFSAPRKSLQTEVVALGFTSRWNVAWGELVSMLRAQEATKDPEIAVIPRDFDLASLRLAASG